MDGINVHIRVLDKSWDEMKDIAHHIANIIEEKYPELAIYILDVEEV